MTAVVQVVVGVPQLPPTPMWIWFQEIGVPILGFAFGAFVVWQVARTSSIEQIQGQAGVTEDLALRVGDLEERLDFAERLLTKERERRERIEPGR
jgi:hypothetical protein